MSRLSNDADMTSDASNPVEPKPSSSVLLVRDTALAPEFLMIRRCAGDAFGDTFAFPGGVVDDNEADADPWCCGRSATGANQLFGLENGLSYYTAIIRELFEETHILLAMHKDTGTLPDETTLRECREKLNSGAISWTEFLSAHNLQMCGDQLHYFAYWETPLDQPKRWSTRFFLARMPDGQMASHDGVEITDHRWLCARDSLVAWDEGSLPMPLPTVRILRDMTDKHSVRELLDWADATAARPIAKIRPERVPGSGGKRYAIKGDPDYPGVEIP